MKEAASTVTPTCVQAEKNDFLATAYDELASSLPMLKQQIGKAFSKATASRPRPIRLSRLRARSSCFDSNAFLQPDTLLLMDVRLQI